MATLPGLKFGAAISDRVQIASTAALEGLTTWTAVALVYPTTLTGGVAIIGKGNFAGNSRRIEIRLAGTGGNIGTFIDGNTTDLNYLTSTTPLATLNRWYWVAAVCDLNAGTGLKVKYYVAPIGGAWVAQGITATAEGSGGWRSDAGATLNIGNNSGNDVAWVGSIAFAALSNQALNLAEIEEIRKSGGSSPFPGALGAWGLGAHGSLVVLDKTGGGNHGAVTGAVSSGERAPLVLLDEQPSIGRWKRALFAPRLARSVFRQSARFFRRSF